MDRIIEIQIRLLIGTAIMFLVGSLIFGVNFISYGVANVVRWAIYIQGALLVIIGIGWPHEAYNIVLDGLYWLIEVNNKYHIITRNVEEVTSLEDGSLDIEKAFGKKEGTNKFLTVIEKTIRALLPAGIDDEEIRTAERGLLNADEKLRFDSLWLTLDSVETARMILCGKKFVKLGDVPGKDNTVTVPPLEVRFSKEA